MHLRNTHGTRYKVDEASKQHLMPLMVVGRQRIIKRVINHTLASTSKLALADFEDVSVLG
jgi:hypothetical protein